MDSKKQEAKARRKFLDRLTPSDWAKFVRKLATNEEFEEAKENVFAEFRILNEKLAKQ